jgi:O-antigen/teichoic acid export membrane protein
VELNKGLLAKNTLFNLLGQVIPLIVGFIAIPILIKYIGIQRFGVLSIIWMVVGYFSLFDMGIGRATTKFVAESLAKGIYEDLADLIWTSIVLLILFGIIGCLIIILLTPWLVQILNIPSYLISETRYAFYWLAISIPAILGASGARGVLEAEQKFALVNYIKVPASIATFLLPLTVIPYSISLVPITILLVISRLLFFLIYLYYCLKSLPGLMSPRLPKRPYCMKLLNFGGWLTITNIVGPFMTYMDRFIVGIILGVAAVAYYSTPYDLVTKLLIIPGSIMGVIFSAFSFYSTGDSGESSSLYNKTFRWTLIAMTPLTLFFVILAKPFLGWWLGHEFITHSTLVLQIMAVGVIINSFGTIPYGLIQAYNRPDLTAKLHIVEFPIYLVLIWMLTLKLGINGVAIAWVIRVLIDTIVLILIAKSITGITIKDNLAYSTLVILILTLLVLGISRLMNGSGLYTLFFITLLVTAYMFWHVNLETEERQKIIKYLSYVLKSKDKS